MLTPEQIEFRKNGIGGSDVAAIFGLSRWKTPLDIYLDKTGQSKPQKETEWQMMGKKLENIIAEVFEEKTGKEIIKPVGTYIHTEKPFMIANIDREIAGESAILECKNTMFSDGWGEEGTDEIPDEYLLQCAHYAIVKNVERVYIAVLISGALFKNYCYERNEKLEKAIIAKEDEFWNEHVLKKKPPPIKNVEDAKKLYAYSVFSSLTATTQIKEWLRTFKEIKESMKTMQADEENLKTLILGEMQFNELITDEFGNKLASWKTQEMNKLDIDLFKKEHPDLYKQYLRPVSFRKFFVR